MGWFHGVISWGDFMGWFHGVVSWGGFAKF